MQHIRRPDPGDAQVRRIVAQMRQSMELACSFARHARELRLAREVCAGRGLIVGRIETELRTAVEHTDRHIQCVETFKAQLRHFGQTL